jgi:hypothetical protein
MARVSIHAMKPAQGPFLDHYVQASIDKGMDEHGHYGELVYAGIEDHERAKKIRYALFRAKDRMGVSLKADVEECSDGTFQVRFHVIDKAIARAYIAQKSGGDPSKLSYNPYLRRNRRKS